MVAIKHDAIALDFHDGKNLRMAVCAVRLQLSAYFHARGKLSFGDALHQSLVAHTERVFWRQVKRGLKADSLAFQRHLHFGKDVVIAAVQVDHRVGAFVQNFALGIRHFVAQGDGGVFFDFHKAGFVEKEIVNVAFSRMSSGVLKVIPFA